MERPNRHKDPRITQALEEIEAVKQALFKKGTITEQEVENEKS